MKKETKKQREERRNAFISYALGKNLGMVDDKIIIKEAGELFDEQNDPRTKGTNKRDKN